MRLAVTKLLVVCALAFVALNAAAATRYVSDQLPVNMRHGPGTQFRITHQLKSGDKVQVVGTTKGWTEVRTGGGSKGWILTRFLSKEPSTRQQVAGYKQKVDSLKRTSAELKKELAKALHGSSELGETKRKLVAENKDLSKQLARIKRTSADAVRISRQNKKYHEKVLSMQSDVDQLRHENQALQSRREGIKIGALIMVIGIIIGVILPMFRRRRRGGWDSSL